MSFYLKKIILILGDAAIFYFSLTLTVLIRYPYSNAIVWRHHFYSFSLILPVWIVIFYIADLYNLQKAQNTLDFFTTLTKALVSCFTFAVIIFYFFPIFGITPKANLFLDLALFSILIIIWRQIFNHLAKSTFQIPLAIITQNPQNERIANITHFIDCHPQLGYRINLIIQPTTPISQIRQLIKTKKIQLVIIDQIKPQGTSVQIFQLVSSLNIDPINLTSAYEKIAGYFPLSIINEEWISQYYSDSIPQSQKIIKRIFDLMVSLILLPIFCLLYPLIALLIKINSAGPAIYCQKRIGQKEKKFILYKFRTMQISAEKNGPQWAQPNDPRITLVGKFLRKAHLDELPQIINIIRGEISLVGPRPERPEFVNYLKQEIPFYYLRHLVKPGITGWAQINFRYGRSIKDTIRKLEFDLWYIKNQSIWTDLKIILKTIRLFFPQKEE